MRLLAAILLCMVGLSASTPWTRLLAEPLPHDAYIWQRVWTPALLSAVRQSVDIVRSWRVLIAEADRSGRWATVAVPWAEIAASQRPIVAVLRIDGRLDEARMPAMLERIGALVDALPSGVSGVEIDYDCPTSKLEIYTRFLAGLRQRLPRTLALSITALPTWMNSTALERLVRDLDEVVLQVHAVDDPRRGLFDPAKAERWVRAFGQRIGRPFRVALPAYDVRVSWRTDGRLASVEGEMPLLTGGPDGDLLAASPDAVLRFLHALARSTPDGLVGVAWFRLPTDRDARAWSLDTWRAVIADRLPPARLSANLVPTDRPGLWNVSLSNAGVTDIALPRQVRLAATCALADGANGFRLIAGQPLVLEATGNGRLRAHGTRTIGWARCDEPERNLNVVQ